MFPYFLVLSLSRRSQWHLKLVYKYIFLRKAFYSKQNKLVFLRKRPCWHLGSFTTTRLCSWYHTYSNFFFYNLEPFQVTYQFRLPLSVLPNCMERWWRKKHAFGYLVSSYLRYISVLFYRKNAEHSLSNKSGKEMFRRFIRERVEKVAW